MGEGPEILLIHGTGASTHSWRGLAPILANHFTVIAPDLPGHAFTDGARGKRSSLPAMAAAVAALVEALALRPVIVVGHSAGAAILIRCCQEKALVPDGIVSVNGALMPFRGAAGFIFPALAKLMFLNPLTPRLMARSAGNIDRVARLIRDTGSDLDPTGVELYARLFRNPEHVAATLGMMAQWDLRPLARELSELDVPLMLIAGDNDRAVAPEEAERISRRVAGSRVERIAGLGHLAHEEDPAAVATIVARFADTVGG